MVTNSSLALAPTALALGLALTAAPPAQVTGPSAWGDAQPWEAGIQLGPGASFNTQSGAVLLRVPIAGWGNHVRGPAVALELRHNSLAAHAGVDLSGSFALGPGWSVTVLSNAITELSASQVELRESDGRTVLFAKLGGVWDCVSPGFHMTLTEDANAGPTEPRWVVTTKDGRTASFDPTGRLMSLRDPSSNELTVGYSVQGAVEEIVDADGRILRFAYASGRLDTITDVHHGLAPWKVEYDAQSRMSALRDIDQSILYSFSYDGSNHVELWTDPGGHPWCCHYRADGRLDRFDDPLQANALVLTYEVLSAGPRTTVADKRSNPWRYLYDLQGRLRKQRDPLGNATTFTRDADNNLTVFIDERGKEWRYEYDAVGNLTSATNPLDRVTGYAYDAGNNLTAVTNAAGKTWSLAYADPDNPDLLTRGTEPADGQGNPAAHSDLTFHGSSNPTLRRRLQSALDANSVETRPSYGPFLPNEIEEGITGGARAIREAFTWGTFGNLLSRSFASWSSPPAFPGSPNIPASPLAGTLAMTGTFDVQWMGQIDTIQAQITTPLPGEALATRHEDHDYDALGRITRTTVTTDEATAVTGGSGTAVVSTVDVAYDNGAGTVTMTSASGDKVVRSYDAANRIASISSTIGGNAGPSATFAYEPDGLVKTVSYGNGAKADYAYYGDGSMQSVRHTRSGQLFALLEYTYDVRRLPSTVQETRPTTSATTTYIYDDRHRLLNEKRVGAGAYEIGYTYDQLGNRKTKTRIEGPTTTRTTYVYDVDTPGGVAGSQNNRLLSSQTLTNGTLATDTWYYYENGAGHVTYVASKNTSSPVYAGQRFVYAQGGWLYLSIHETFELDASGDPINVQRLSARETRQVGFHRYRSCQRDPATWSPSDDLWSESVDALLPFSDYRVDSAGSRTDERLYVGRFGQQHLAAGASYYRHEDALRSERLVSDAAGAIVADQLFTAFGEPRQVSPTSTRFGFTGGHGGEAGLHAGSSSTHLVRTGARYLDARTGRYIMRDPVGIAGGLNTYDYARQVPTASVDPWGLSPQANKDDDKKCRCPHPADRPWWIRKRFGPPLSWFELNAPPYMPEWRHIVPPKFGPHAGFRVCGGKYTGPKDTPPPILKSGSYKGPRDTPQPDRSSARLLPRTSGLVAEFTSRNRPRD